MLIHIVPALIALAVGPLQLNSWFRQRNINVHRIIGWLYVICVFLGGVGAIGLTGATWNDNWLMIAGFMGLSVCWLISLGCAVYRGGCKKKQVKIRQIL